jgi:ribosomal peptide maturation radical SAM protein 1
MSKRKGEFPNPLLKKLLEGGDILIISPPFLGSEIPALGAHSLQASCQHAGLRTRILYANLLFSNVIGLNLYEKIVQVNQATFMGERIFAAAAFDLPPMGRNMQKLFDPGWFPDHIWQKTGGSECRFMAEIFDTVREWAAAIDWDHVENQASRWIESTAEQIINMKYRMVGCSTTNGGLAPAIALLNRVKQADANIITVLGGSLCEGDMAEGILSLKSSIDYVFSGEGETTFPTFARKVLSGHLPGKGIIYGKEVMNLDTISLPNFEEYFKQKEKIYSQQSSSKSSIWVPYETSRGCSWRRCTFCGLNGERMSYRTKSPGKIIEELKQLVNRHNGCIVNMADNIMPAQYFNNLIPQISREIPSIRIQYEVKANLLLEQVIALKKAGITRIQPGIESLSPSLLRRMRKGVTVRQILALLRYARSVGIQVLWNILVGFPGDQTSEYEETLHLLPLIRHLQPATRLSSMKIFRFSQYQVSPEEHEIRDLRPAGLHKDILPSHADLEKIAYYFSGDFKAQSYENPQIIVALEKEYQEWLKEWKIFDLIPLDSLLPKLHLERKSSTRFLLHDTRGLPGRPEKMIVDREKANVLLVAHPWDSSSSLKWALDSQLGVLMESWFIPLATAEPGLLQQFERDYN